MLLGAAADYYVSAECPSGIKQIPFRVFKTLSQTASWRQSAKIDPRNGVCALLRHDATLALDVACVMLGSQSIKLLCGCVVCCFLQIQCA